MEHWLLKEEEIDNGLSQLLKTKFHQGIFDPGKDNP
jgi:hypothetical protein